MEKNNPLDEISDLARWAIKRYFIIWSILIPTSKYSDKWIQSRSHFFSHLFSRGSTPLSFKLIYRLTGEPYGKNFQANVVARRVLNILCYHRKSVWSILSLLNFKISSRKTIFCFFAFWKKKTKKNYWKNY